MFLAAAMERVPCVYILAKASHSTLYTGVSSDLPGRIWQHREGLVRGFTQRYGLTRLVYAEHAPTIVEAIAREKAMKKWNRAWKIELIERANPDWVDLFETINARRSAGFPLSRE